MPKEQTRIEGVLRSYEGALNASDVDRVIALYAPDGVFMPQHFPTQVGAVAVRKAYEAVFETITLDIAFEVLEVEKLSEEWAYARTTSIGTAAVNATGEKSAESNQELFLLNKRPDGEWKIARYIFSTMNPPN